MTYPTTEQVKELRERTGISMLQARRYLARQYLIEEVQKIKSTESYELRLSGLTRVVEYLVTQLPL